MAEPEETPEGGAALTGLRAARRRVTEEEEEEEVEAEVVEGVAAASEWRLRLEGLTWELDAVEEEEGEEDEEEEEEENEDNIVDAPRVRGILSRGTVLDWIR